MINEKMYGLGDEPSAIRELFAYGMARKAEIGAENVFDFSIGNPSVPAPDLVRETMLELLDMDPVTLHAYSPAAGLPEVKGAIAAYLSERYGTTATPGHLYLTAGAAAALASSIAAVTHPGDEVVVVSPYFPEYRTWIEAAGCTVVEVPAAVPSFQPDRGVTVLPRVPHVDRGGRLHRRGGAGGGSELPARHRGAARGHRAEDECRDYQHAEQPGGRRVHPREP